jgi:sec-independent protein translocase protein TatA
MPGFVGFPELLLLGLVVLVLFGPKRLPEMGRGLGRGLREFKDSVTGDHKDSDSLTVPSELTTAPIVVEEIAPANSAAPVAVDAERDQPVAVVRRNVA